MSVVSLRILPDLLEPMNDFVRKSDQVIDSAAMDYLAKRHPEGIRVIDIASYHGLLFVEAQGIVEIALCARQLKVRRDKGATFCLCGGQGQCRRLLVWKRLFYARHSVNSMPVPIGFLSRAQQCICASARPLCARPSNFLFLPTS